MSKQVVTATILDDESVPFGIVEPLDFASWHDELPCSFAVTVLVHGFVVFVFRRLHLRFESPPELSYTNTAWINIILQCQLTFGQSLRRVNSFCAGNVWLNAVWKRYHVRIGKYPARPA